MTVQMSCLLAQPQSILLGLFAGFGWISDADEYNSSETTLVSLNLLLCVEMIVLAFVQIIVFPAKDFERVPEMLKSMNTLEEGLLPK